MPINRDNITRLEKVEIERSAAEAAHTDETTLRMDERQAVRYLDPPAVSPYPLEYSYHLLGDVRGKTVLDFGCGSGINSILLSRRGARVYGMDISEPLVKLAARRLAADQAPHTAKFVVASAYDIPFGDESMDVVFGIAILHHLELLPVSREINRILRKGGRAIFQEPMRNSKFIKRVRGMIPYQGADVSPFEYPLDDGKIREFAAGYTSYRTKAFRLPHISVAELLPVMRNLTHSLYCLDKALLKALPSLSYFATNQVIELTK